jgi:hypothetical protein
MFPSDPFPLQWPEGWKRTPPADRATSRFVTGMQRALKSLYLELERLGAANVIVTSDLPTRTNGQPYGDAADTGISVWFVLDDQERVFACDRWLSAAENVRAIALSIEAIRGMERWGANDIVARAFSGFKALPAANDDYAGSIPHTYPYWRNVLTVNGRPMPTGVPLGYVRRAYRQAMKTAHPDLGGTHEMAVALGTAMQDAEREYLRTQGVA